MSSARDVLNVSNSGPEVRLMIVVYRADNLNHIQCALRHADYYIR